MKPPVVDEMDDFEAEEGQAWIRSFSRGERSRDRFHVGVDFPLELLAITRTLRS